MARARNIKPSFFDNDILAEHNCPLGRLFFIGLWTLADCNGNLEWRPKRIKAKLLPYDDVDIKNIAINLDNSGFIRFYSDQEKIYINITNFLVHQNPHKNEREKGGVCPDYCEKGRQVIDFKDITINRDKSGGVPIEDGTNPADSLNLIPDSLNLIPDCLNAPSGAEAPPATEEKTELEEKPSPVITLTLNDKTEYPIFEHDVSEWLDVFPAVDVVGQLKKMRLWLNDNPTKRKTKAGIRKFVSTWLGREQDRGGGRKPPNMQGGDFSGKQYVGNDKAVEAWV